jgi:hypothetical protein
MHPRKCRSINQVEEILVQVLRERLSEQWVEMPSDTEATDSRAVDSIIFFAG